MCLIDGKGERGVQNTEQNAVLLRLAREYGDSVVRMCCVYLKDYHLAQDVAQETFLQAARKYGALARTDSEKAWLMRIAVNRCKNELRTQWFRRAQELPEPSGAGCAGSVCAAAGRLSAAVNSSADSKRFFMADWLCRLISVGQQTVCRGSGNSFA